MLRTVHFLVPATATVAYYYIRSLDATRYNTSGTTDTTTASSSSSSITTFSSSSSSLLVLLLFSLRRIVLIDGSSLLEDHKQPAAGSARDRTLEVHGNVVKHGDGGGLAVSGDSQVKMSTTVVTLAFNAAGAPAASRLGAGVRNRGGGLFVNSSRLAESAPLYTPTSTPTNASTAISAARVVFWQLHVVGNRALGDGGVGGGGVYVPLGILLLVRRSREESS